MALLLSGCLLGTDSRPPSNTGDRLPLPEECLIINDAQKRDRCYFQSMNSFIPDHPVDALKICLKIGDTEIKSSCIKNIAPFLARYDPMLAYDSCKRYTVTDMRDKCVRYVINNSDLLNRIRITADYMPEVFLLQIFLGLLLLAGVVALYIKITSFYQSAMIRRFARLRTAREEYGGISDNMAVQSISDNQIEDVNHITQTAERKRKKDKKEKIKKITVADEDGFHEITVIEDE